VEANIDEVRGRLRRGHGESLTEERGEGREEEIHSAMVG
jgi:hypothetical protein